MTGPDITYTETNVTITDTTEAVMMTHICRGIKAGERIILMAGFDFVAEGSTTVMGLRIRETDAVGGTAVTEEILTDARDQNDSINWMCATIAYQDDPIYSLTALQTAAAGNGTFEAGYLGHIPAGKS